VPYFPQDRDRKKRFRLIALEDAQRLTGLELDELLFQTDTQRVTRVDRQGNREELLRVPLDALLDGPAAS
jgi:hypothetical protein